MDALGRGGGRRARRAVGEFAAVPATVLAIDHILLRDADAAEVHTVRLPGSGHRGIWAAITLRRNR